MKSFLGVVDRYQSSLSQWDDICMRVLASQRSPKPNNRCIIYYFQCFFLAGKYNPLSLNILGDVPEVCKSTLFEMPMRRCMRRLKDASEMPSCRLGKKTQKQIPNFSFPVLPGFLHFAPNILSETVYLYLRLYFKFQKF